ncbi:MAG: hypothetical protein ACI361_03025 [Atopobiaceae bacterium]
MAERDLAQQNGTAPEAPQWVDGSSEDDDASDIPLVWMEDGDEHPFEPQTQDSEPWLDVMNTMLEDERKRKPQAPKSREEDPEEAERRRMKEDLLKWV